MDAPPDVARTSPWSLKADWTEPLRSRPVPVLIGCAAVAALLCGRIGPRPELPALLYLGVVSVLLTAVDIALRRLPDPLTLPSYVIGALLLGAAVPFTDGGGARFTHALIGMAALWALFAVQWFAMPKAMGFGDVKLSGVLGLYLGWYGASAWMLGTFAMFATGGVFSIALLVSRRADRKGFIPFGPFMLLGALIGVFLHAG
ncbi:prepilin peptidase [Actinomadura macrotermitis]|uniref:Prepilin type IV endopeptidase peptidase domain-containing protein n=1 Tax=Actinomadura macrotermitis TaxID=2585200 RepID=A0A7K0BME2_9ACTN|nr:hypothetical protein [Actinomadura macrotermitis]